MYTCNKNTQKRFKQCHAFLMKKRKNIVCNKVITLVLTNGALFWENWAYCMCVKCRPRFACAIRTGSSGSTRSVSMVFFFLRLCFLYRKSSVGDKCVPWLASKDLSDMTLNVHALSPDFPGWRSTITPNWYSHLAVTQTPPQGPDLLGPASSVSPPANTQDS